MVRVLVLASITELTNDFVDPYLFEVKHLDDLVTWVNEPILLAAADSGVQVYTIEDTGLVRHKEIEAKLIDMYPCVDFDEEEDDGT